jgi:hypothetical protein
MSGSGKTFTLRKMISHMLQTSGENTPRIHLFDVHGDITVQGASSVRFSEQTDYGLNPLRVCADPHFGGVRKRIQAFINTMNRVMRGLGVKQEAALRNILIDVYEAHGFKVDDPDTWHVDSDSPVLMSDGDDSRLYLDVPRGEKDDAKALGAKWTGSPLFSWCLRGRNYALVTKASQSITSLHKGRAAPVTKHTDYEFHGHRCRSCELPRNCQ